MVDGVLELDFPRASQRGDADARLGALVLGPENRLLASVVQRLLAAPTADQAAAQYNPLVLVGPSGSGKSHLAQGLVRRFSATGSAAYYTAADFAREFDEACQGNQLDAWHAKLQSFSLLVIEDIQHLRPRSPAQLELRSAMDRREASGAGLLLVTADREVASLGHLELGLRDRLAAGLTVRLQRPGLESRRAVVRLVARSRQFALGEHDVERLARRESGAVAQLIGHVLHDRAGRHGEPADPAGEGPLATDDALHKAHDAALRGHTDMKRIVSATARWFGVTQAALRGPSRRASLVRARNVAVHLARRLTDLSYADIGRGLGGRDHTTAIHADRRIQEQLADDPAIRQAVDDLDRLLR